MVTGNPFGFVPSLPKTGCTAVSGNPRQVTEQEGIGASVFSPERFAMFRAAALALLLPLACLASAGAAPLVTPADVPDNDAADKTLQEALA